NRVVVAAEAHVMAHDFRLGETRQADGTAAALAAEAAFGELHIGQVDTAMAFTADLEDQRLFVVEAAVAGDGRRGRAFGGRARLAGAALVVHRHLTEPPPAPWRARRHLRRYWFRWRRRSAGL